MAEVWEFHHLQWCYSIDGRVSSGIYVSREKAEAASRKPQHFSRHALTTRPVHHWLHGDGVALCLRDEEAQVYADKACADQAWTNAGSARDPRGYTCWRPTARRSFRDVLS
jgi:hypothetical protein